jgi:hypothetical protein
VEATSNSFNLSWGKFFLFPNNMDAYSLFQIIFGFFIDKFIQYNIEQGLTVLVESRTVTILESLSGMSRAAFHHINFSVMLFCSVL